MKIALHGMLWQRRCQHCSAQLPAFDISSVLLLLLLLACWPAALQAMLHPLTALATCAFKTGARMLSSQAGSGSHPSLWRMLLWDTPRSVLGDCYN
jgi:hypothetical protein